MFIFLSTDHSTQRVSCTWAELISARQQRSVGIYACIMYVVYNNCVCMYMSHLMLRYYYYYIMAIHTTNMCNREIEKYSSRYRVRH